jgi:hypothetical protein
MILIDLSQFLISSLFAQMGRGKADLDENLLRHIFVNSIRNVRMRHKDRGELVIACDDKEYWRKGVFPYYKASRKKARDESGLDWDTIFKSLNKFRDELKEFFPYKVIQVPTAEADDIIAVLAKHYYPDNIVIVSSDKDYLQLQKYPLVSQYNPITKTFMLCLTPEQTLFEHIARGDTGDGIPNCLSPDNTFVLGQRQKNLTAKKLMEIEQTGIDSLSEEVRRNFLRNKSLIDFDYIPSDISKQILDQYMYQTPLDKRKLFDYFIQYNLKNLQENIGDF